MENASGGRSLALSVYFAEAVPHPISTRSSSPAPQVPSVTVEFSIVAPTQPELDSKAIQIVIGSDVLRSHNADILFSSNSMTIFDDDQCKLSIPLVRPENEATFNSLFISSSQPTEPHQHIMPEEQVQLNGLGQTEPNTPSNELMFDDEPLQTVADTPQGAAELPTAEEDVKSSKPQPSVSKLVRSDNKDPATSTQVPPSAPSTSSPSIWSNWRRETSSQNNDSETAGAASKTKDIGYQRRDAGIKVLRPTRSSGRTFSSGSVASSPAGDGRSRYFDEGKKRGLDTVAGDEKVTRRTGEGQGEAVTSKTRSNPAGGASAFSWLHPGNGA